MKKILISPFLLIVSLMLFGCQKSTPIAPVATAIVPTVTVTATSTGVFSSTETATLTNVYSATVTTTLTLTQTSTATFTVTITLTLTSVPTPNGGAEVLVSVPGGTFTQTDAAAPANYFIHTISAFKMGKYEVTYNLWYTVYQWAILNGYTFANAGMEGNSGSVGLLPSAAKYQPVTNINWRDIIVWCNAYSQKSGLTLMYYSNAGLTTPIKDSTDGAYGSIANITAGSSDNPYINWTANGYRLPTEGEWQYAASYKNGSSWTPYNYASGATAAFSNSAATQLVAWDWENSGNVSHVVGGRTPNALGIYDMSGNALECLWDWGWQISWTNPGTVTDYRGPASGAASSAGHVSRGGSYNGSPTSTQVGYSGAGVPYGEWWMLGFRIAKSN